VFHEVRTPLNSLVLGLQCLSDLKDRCTSTEQEVLDMMAVGTEHINKTLNDVLSFQTIDEGLLVLDFTWFEPTALLKMMHRNFQ
jgi:signal transduction histidine kinase